MLWKPPFSNNETNGFISWVRKFYKLHQIHSECLSGGLTKTKEKFRDKTAAKDLGKSVDLHSRRTNLQAVLSLGHLQSNPPAQVQGLGGPRGRLAAQ